MNLADLRQEYTRAELDESRVAADPIEQFRKWFDEAAESGIVDRNAMTLATANAEGRPSARIVLLKDITVDSFVFFTDYRSRKANELDANAYAALVFHWAVLERQVRITGRVERVDSATSWAYFRTRPEGSRLGAWASIQSSPLADRRVLEDELARVTAEFAGREIPLPPHWGGYRVLANEVEFWQGRANRLHDRIRYSRAADGSWQCGRLSP